MKIWTPILVDGTEDQYKIYTDNKGTMLCDDQDTTELVKLDDVMFALKKCEGDIDMFKFLLPKSKWPYEDVK
jgi:hypothetical protein